MTIVINGTTGISGVDGSAATPAVQGADTNTGVFYPAADTVGVSTNGTERMRVDSSGNVGIGTASPGARLQVTNTDGEMARFRTSSGSNQPVITISASDSAATVGFATGGNASFPAMTFANGGSERMRIDSSGNVGIGTTSPSYRLDVSGAATATPVTNGIIRILTTGSNPPTGYGGGLVFSQVDSSAVNRDYASITGSRVNSSANNQVDMVFSTGDPGGGSIPVAERMRLTTAGNLLVGTTATNNNERVRIKNGNDTRAIAFQSASAAECGYIYINAGGTTTTYSTSSDYRLKENILPMTDALAKVQALKPVTYKWKLNGFDGQGFIAHELQEVCPDAVTGSKDAVDENGNPVYQGIDTSFLVATLTAAIQEQQALITALTARIEALENE